MNYDKRIRIELIKQRKWIPVFCVILPLMLNLLLLLSLSTRYEGYLLPHMQELKLTYWQLIFKEQTILYFSELCHIVVAALVFETFYIELKDNGWMLIASTQYRKWCCSGEIYSRINKHNDLFHIRLYIIIYNWKDYWSRRKV